MRNWFENNEVVSNPKYTYIQWILLNVGMLGPALFAHIKRLPIKTEISFFLNYNIKKNFILQKKY